MDDTSDQTSVSPTAAAASGRITLVEGAVFLAAVLGRLPALGAWWNLDDWGQLGRAAGLGGLDGAAGVPARWLSQHFYWTVTWPLFGLDADAHAVIRLILHGLCAVLVARIGRRAGLADFPRLVAGLLFAASPLAFTPLYWASGIQELLGAFFALVAVERWLAGDSDPAGSRRNLTVAFFAAVLSMLSKEAGLGLPLLFLAFMWAGIGVRLKDKAFAWALVMFLLLAAVSEGVLVYEHFAPDQGGAYALGDVGNSVINIGVFGWWLMSPGPILASHLKVSMGVAGGALWLLWAIWGWIRWRHGQKLPGLALLGSLLAVGPAIPLYSHLNPYLAYLAAAGVALTLGSLLPVRWRPRPVLLMVLVVATIAWGLVGMRVRLSNRTDLGLVADPVARATSLSWQACRTMVGLQEASASDPFRYLTLMQPPIEKEQAALAGRMGEVWVHPSETYNALHGEVGPRLVLGPAVEVTWANGLVTSPPAAMVFCETATGFKVWGRTGNALLYAALTDVGLGHFDRAVRHLARASQLSDESVAFLFDEGQMVIPLQMVVDRKEAFTDWTLGRVHEGSTPLEIGGLQDMFFNLLSICTGRSVEELTAGSRVLNPQGQ